MITFVEDDVLDSALEPDSADAIVSAFGLKTFNATRQLRLAYVGARILSLGGSVAMVEASDPRGWWLRLLYLFHLTRVLPLVERLVLRGAQHFALIGAYCLRFGSAEGFAKHLRGEGLEATCRPLFFGCATLVTGREPAPHDSCPALR